MELTPNDIDARDGTRLRLWELSPERADEAVLFLHGAITSSRALLAPPTGGTEYSWLHGVASRGRAAFALDVRGYGDSERPPELDRPAGENDPVVRAPQAALDAADAIDAVTDRFETVHLVTISWGTMYGGLLLSGQHPEAAAPEVATLTLCAPVHLPEWEFGPLAERFGIERPMGAYFVRAKENVEDFEDAGEPFRASWRAQVESGQGIDDGRYLAPTGAQADVRDATEGTPVYDAEGTEMPPTLVLRGTEDTIATREDSLGLYDALSADRKEYAEVDGTGHYLMFETHRHRVYSLVDTFQGDAPDV